MYREPPAGSVKIEVATLKRVQQVLLNIGSMPSACVMDVPHWDDVYELRDEIERVLNRPCCPDLHG